MIAPESKGRTPSETVKLSEPIAAVEVDEGPNPAQVLADLYRRCGRGGGCPYSLDQLLSVLSALRYHGRAEARELGRDARLPGRLPTVACSKLRITDFPAGYLARYASLTTKLPRLQPPGFDSYGK